MGNYDTIIFDLDGTLLNTLQDVADSVNFALTSYSFPSKRIDEIKNLAGSGARSLIRLSMPGQVSDALFENCLKSFFQHYSLNMQNKTNPYKGIMVLLETLSTSGYKIAIVSNKFDSAVKELTKVYFGKYIKVAIGESQNTPKKPAPDLIYKALKELNSVPAKTVYVGDSEIDVKTAKNSSITCVGVTWGFRSRTVLEREGANYIIDNPQELLEVLELK